MYLIHITYCYSRSLALHDILRICVAICCWEVLPLAMRAPVPVEDGARLASLAACAAAASLHLQKENTK